MPDTDEETKQTLRQIKESMTELFVALGRTVFFWIPGGDVAKGKALMACHPFFILIVICAFFLAPARSPLRLIILIMAIMTVASQWLLGGCVVTRAEQRLTGSNETIMDSFLRLAHLPVNRETRISLTIGSSTAIVALMIWAFVCDHIKTFTPK
jgi:hypothetical protein